MSVSKPKIQKMLQELDELEVLFVLAVTVLLCLKEKGRLEQAVEVLQKMDGKS